MARIVNIISAIQFIRKLNTPFIKTDAYKLGIIDADGVRTKKPLKTYKDKAAWSYFDIIINNLKKLLAKLPGGNSNIARVAATLLLLRENHQISYFDSLLDNNLLEKKFYEYFDQVSQQLVEDGAINCVGGGNIAGIGIGPQGEPPIRKKIMNKYKRANKKGEEAVSSIVFGMIRRKV